MSEDLRDLERWLGEIIAGLAPAKRLRMATKVGQALRRANLQRIAANVEPDGTAMERRKPRFGRRKQLRKSAGGKMFKGLRLTRNWTVKADADGVELAPTNGLIDRIAAISHYGEEATVGRLRNGKRIRVRYAERRLLGLSDDDLSLLTDAAAALIEPDGR